MLTFAAPGFLLAGLLAMLVPLALHLIRRRPPGRAPLPTARFLSPDPRNAVRVSRPTDIPLLILRMLLLGLLGAALSRPAWLPSPEGTSTVVLLDRGRGMDANAWRAGVGAARDALLRPDGEAAGELVLFDTAAVTLGRARLTAATFDSLLAAGPTGASGDFAAAMRAIPPAARRLRGADSVRVRMISPLSQSGWSPGLAPLRKAAWPGSINITRLPLAPAAADSAGGERLAFIVSSTGGRYAGAALGALGYTVQGIAPNGVVPQIDRAVYLVLDPPSRAVAEELTERVARGSTLVFAPAAVTADLRGVAPWRGQGAERAGGGTMWMGADLRLGGAVSRVAGEPAEGARAVAAWDDGRPAAAARRVGEGCIVFVGTQLEGGELPFQAEYPAAMGRLARACDGAAAQSIDRPLDAGALSILAGRGPSTVSASRLGAAGEGFAFGRWLLLAAILIALVETLLAYRRRSAV